MDSFTHKAYQHCIRLTRRSGSNFAYAFCALPRDMYAEMCVLYAFMRHTDDLGDAGERSTQARIDDLKSWRARLNQTLDGESSTDLILEAIADVWNRKQIPRCYLLDVVDGVETDLQPGRIVTITDLERYMYRVAGAVGLCCISIWGYEGPLPLESAIACGHAFQLTNILRDLGEDAEIGRIYLPDEDLARFGVPSSEIAEPRHRDAVRQLVRFEVARVKDYYHQAEPIYSVLSPPGRRIQAAFTDLYQGLLNEIEQADYDVLTKRIRLSRWKKLSVSLRCLLGWGGIPITAAPATTSARPPQRTHSGK
ncbi:MAG: phytoene/squalene synthase family protein [Planctomycetaceae bacterium]|nr:phytoene/squalene synthase family protein [Planctomycetaceae bacterium]